ncbi:hypothetical protein [Kitasatospora sp. NPDC094015]|uniref:F0F1 ATP synthase subunit B family protein n=1 Tax=Kitasatospora sp. NPDC094015 TaxID=3155205 RepID=UPI003325001A
MGPLEPDPAELLVGLVVFFLMFAVLGKVLLPRVERMLTLRRDATEGRQERAEQLRAEAEDTLAALRHELDSARHEAARIRQEATEQGLVLMAEIRAEGRRECAALLADARAAIARDRALAEAELHGEVGDLAVELAGRVVGEPLSGIAQQRRIVERFLATRTA